MKKEDYENILNHSRAVAEYMYENCNGSEELKSEMYALGLLHDIGKFVDKTKNHNETGFYMCHKVDYKYTFEVLMHGTPYNSSFNPTDALDLLNEADLSINKKGENIGFKMRLEDIGERYGFNSKEYESAKKLQEQLLEKKGTKENAKRENLYQTRS